MKKLFVLFVAVLFVSILANTSQAALIDNGNGTVTDTDTNLMWLKNTSLDVDMNWSDATAWADNLVYATYDDWRLPAHGSCTGFNCTDSEMGYLYYTSLGNTAGYGGLTNYGLFYPYLYTNPGGYWSSYGYTNIYGPQAGYFVFSNLSSSNGIQEDDFATLIKHVWAVRTAAIPEPASILLLGSGLVGLFGLKRRNK